MRMKFQEIRQSADMVVVCMSEQRVVGIGMRYCFDCRKGALYFHAWVESGIDEHPGAVDIEEAGISADFFCSAEKSD